jgi:ribonuclease J
MPKKFNPLDHKNDFLFVPLGGCGEIGMNMNLYHHKGKWIMVDCGVGFADYNFPGVTLMLPNIDFIIKNQIKISAIIITHIHEDHIGGVIHLWEWLQCKIYTTPLAATFLREKIRESGIKSNIQIKIIQEDGEFEIDGFQISTMGLTHSVPEMKALAIQSPAGIVFHTGDWKLDPKPLVGEESDLKTIKSICRNGAYAMVCDSTNVFNEGWSGSEGDLEKNITDIVKKAKNRVVITTFASNIARLQTISNVARATNRQLVVAGRSLWRMIDAARKNNYLLDTIEFIDQKGASSIPREETLILCTGCQGEENAALTKISSDQHPHIQLDKGDMVLFSSKIIPGNEKKIFNLFNNLTELDIDIVTEKTKDIHVSGHPNRKELKKLYSIVKPEYAIPVHGEVSHIKEHAELAESEFGVKKSIRPRNGDVWLFEKGHVPKKIAKVDQGYVLIDGTVLRHEKSRVIYERKIMSDGGSVVLMLLTNQSSITGLKVATPGFITKKEDHEICMEFERLVQNELKTLVKLGDFRQDRTKFSDSLSRSTLKIAERLTGKRPHVSVTICDVHE